MVIYGEFVTQKGACMKSSPMAMIISTIALFTLNFGPKSLAQEKYNSENIENFHDRLNGTFRQSNEDTIVQQIIYGSIEALAAYKLDSFITYPDRKEILSITVQIRALEERRAAKYFPNEPLMSERERQAKISQLSKRLREIEGGIGERMKRGTAKFFIRGTQIILVLDFGARIYILNFLDHRDPGFIPLKTLACSEMDCVTAFNKLMKTSHDTYTNSRRIINPELNNEPISSRSVVTPVPSLPAVPTSTQRP